MLFEHCRCASLRMGYVGVGGCTARSVGATEKEKRLLSARREPAWEAAKRSLDADTRNVSGWLRRVGRRLHPRFSCRAFLLTLRCRSRRSVRLPPSGNTIPRKYFACWRRYTHRLTAPSLQKRRFLCDMARRATCSEFW